MTADYTSSFTVSTDWPELVNKKIKTIDSSLKEFVILNHHEMLVVNGVIEREIRYQEFDGRARKSEDKIQFEAILGASLPEPLPTFEAELRSINFVFQPRRLGVDRAVLNQQFSLLVTIKSTEHPANISGDISVLADIIESSGKNDQIIRIELPMISAGNKPKQFEGTVRFDEAPAPPVIGGSITGNLLIRMNDSSIQELELCHTFNFLTALPEPSGQQHLKILGEIGDVVWIPSNGYSHWIMELKITYNWQYLCRKEITCMEIRQSNDQSQPQYKLPVFIGELERHLATEAEFTELIGENPEIKLESSSVTTQITKRGLLVTARVLVGIYSVSGAQEIYGQQEIVMDELISSDLTAGRDPSDLFLKDRLIPQVIKLTRQNFKVLVIAGFKYCCRLYRSQLVSLSGGNESDPLVSCACLVNQISFSLAGEEMLRLRGNPQIVKAVRTSIHNVSVEPRDGWLIAGGELMVPVSYIDNENRFREDVFKIIFQKSILCQGILRASQIDLTPRLEYDSFTLNESGLCYRYFIKLEAKLFSETAVRVDTRLRISSGPSKPEEDTRPPAAIGTGGRSAMRLAMEEDISLKLGSPKEITTGRTYIEQFSCRRAMNALFVEGKLGGEVEYWDEDGYLRQETINYPFWRFVQLKADGLFPDPSSYWPEIRNYSFLPVRSWPWRHGALKLKVEIELLPPKTEGGSGD
jgi:hypothetical protein